MLRLLASIAIFLLPLAAFAQDKAVAALEGTFEVKEFDRAGKPVADEIRKAITSVKIEKGKLTIQVDGKEIVAVLKADPAKKPAELDLLPQGKEFDKGKKFPGVYTFEKDVLTICYVEDGDRPKELKSEATTSTRLVLVKK